MSWSDNNNNDPWGSSGNGSGRRGPGPNMDDVAMLKIDLKE